MADDDADDDDALFSTLLEKHGATWLKTQLEALKLAPTPAPTPAPGAQSDPFATYLSGELGEAKKEARALREALEKTMDLLTPEQRTLLRSPKSADAAPPDSPPRKEPPAPPPAKKPGWLKRL